MVQAVCRAVVAGRRWWGALALVVGLSASLLAGQVAPITQSAGRFTVVAFARDSALGAFLLKSALAEDSFPSLPRPTWPALISIAPDKQSFRDWVGAGAPEWGAAFAFPAERRIVLQGRYPGADLGDPGRVLRHELAHLALAEHLAVSAPRWFSEGYASFAAREWDRDAIIAANIGLAFRGFRTLAELDSAFSGGPVQSSAAYALAFRAVSDLAELDPGRGLERLFEQWRVTGSFDLSLRRGFGLTQGGFEERWRSTTRRRYGALALTTDVAVGAFVLLLIIAPLYVLRRRRDAERFAAMKEADLQAEREERERALAELLSERSAGPDAGDFSS